MQIGLLIALFCLLVFGFIYDQFVAWLEYKEYDEGFTALLVIFGTLTTLIASGPFIGWDNFLIVLSFFGASGFFMTVGSIKRYVEAKEKNNEFWKNLIERNNHDPTQTGRQ